MDFYPDEFNEEQYGSLREHEYIALIPFLDINLVKFLMILDYESVRLVDCKCFRKGCQKKQTSSQHFV